MTGNRITITTIALIERK